MPTPLCELARKHGTDKSGHHEYTPVYWSLFAKLEDKVKTVLEIGIGYECHGTGNSLRMWEEFFPNAQIHGIDTNTAVLINKGRIRSYIADQNNADMLRSVADLIGEPFDLIVDDGSHVLEHQITSMLTLLPYLSYIGVYVVEDLEHDCRPEELTNHIPPGYDFMLRECAGVGCGCGCNGPEQLVVVWKVPGAVL